MTVTRVAVNHVGRIAQALAQKDQSVTALGVTSRGVFTRLDEGWVIFLSYEAQRGPLTVNINEPLRGLPQGEPGRLQKGRLIFDNGWEVNGLNSATVWEAPLAPARCQSVEAQREALVKIATIVIETYAAPGISGLLAPLLNLPVTLTAPVDPSLVDRLEGLQAALDSGAWEVALHASSGWLGLGSGLTPSGDDLLLGLLLGVKRCCPPQKRDPSDGQAGFCEAVTAAARQRTTALSASLLACAAQGQADERLVAALDGILTGSPSPETCASLLLRWGSSSGVDALVGMALAVLSAGGTSCP